MPPDFDDDEENYLPTDEAEAKEKSAAELDPMRTSDPHALIRRLRDRVFDLQDRIDAQDFVKRIDELSADLACGADGRKAAACAETARRAEARALHGAPSGMKSATRAIGRLLDRCETALEDLIGEPGRSLDLESRLKIAVAAARLASAASSLGHAMSASARTRAQLMRLRSARAPRKAGDAQGSEA